MMCVEIHTCREVHSEGVKYPAVRRLVQEGKAYPCFCTDEEITQMKAQAEAESRPPIYTGKWAHASAEEVEQEKAKVSSWTTSALLWGPYQKQANLLTVR